MAIVGIMGKPRAGKTCYAARVAVLNHRRKTKYEKRINKSKLYKYLSSHSNKFTDKLINILYPTNFYQYIYCTDDTIPHTVHIEYKDIGKFKPSPYSLWILEEAGIGASSRDYKSLTKDAKRLFALHGHYHNDILWLSQSSDVDKTLRERTQQMYIAHRLSHFTLYRLINYSVDVDEQTHQLGDFYSKQKAMKYLIDIIFTIRKKHRTSIVPSFRSFIVFRPFWYKHFDSYNDPPFEYTLEDPALTYYELEDANILEIDVEKLNEEIEDNIE